MFLSKSSEYAIRTVLYIAIRNENHYLPVHEIAEELQIPFHFLSKIIQTLSKYNIVSSVRGPKGGVTLARPAEQINLLEIIHAIDGPYAFNGCILGLPGCGKANPCPLHDQWATAKENVVSIFTNTTIAELAKKVQEEKLRLAGS